jgi:hypothetical protein
MAKKFSNFIKQLPKSFQKTVKKLSKSCHKVVKICQTFIKIGDNCISIKSRWGWGGGQKVIPRPLADYLGLAKGKNCKF